MSPDQRTQRLENALDTGNWTASSLHDHMTDLFSQLEKRMAERFDAQEKATGVALTAAEKAVTAAMAAAEKAVLKAEALATERAAQQNKWRATIDDITHELGALTLPRSEYELGHAALITKIGEVNDRINRGEGKAQGTSSTVVWLFAGLASLAGLAGVIFGAIELLTR